MLDCIAAIATPHGTGGVAVIRLSGTGCLEIAAKMFEPSGRPRGFCGVADKLTRSVAADGSATVAEPAFKKPSAGGTAKNHCAAGAADSAICARSSEYFEPNRMYPGNIICDGFTDYGYMVYFKAPKTFTSEDCVEFHCHGGEQISAGVLRRAIALGARAAERGEFTRRAFLNGKLSLAAAEGMIEMINAESSAMLRAGGMLYREKLTEEVAEIQRSLKDIIAAICAEIDYPEEDLDGLDFKKINARLKILREEIATLKDGWARGKRLKNGVSVAICGAPNVGKSSVLNAILGYDKAIVSPEAGTTRDIVEGRAEINGVAFDFADTAGIRENAGAIESAGIERAKKIASSADIILYVFSGDSDGDETAETELSRLSSGGAKVIKVFNKCDIFPRQSGFNACISAKTGDGLEELKEKLFEASFGERANASAVIVEERHYDALTSALDAIDSALGESLTADLVAVDLKEAWEKLGEITGETAGEEIINTVFEKFCVGK